MIQKMTDTGGAGIEKLLTKQQSIGFIGTPKPHYSVTLITSGDWLTHTYTYANPTGF